MEQVDVYGPVHKGLRSLLFDAARAIGRTDFGDEADVTATIGGVRRTMEFLEEHARHEDDRILPLLRRGNVWTAEELQSEHTRLEGLQRTVAAQLDRIESEDDAARRQALGSKLYATWNRLVAAHLDHMGVEETKGNRALWAHATDAELLEARRAILDDIGVQRLTQWAQFMLPALDPGERERMASGLRALVPAPLLTLLGRGVEEVER